MSGTTALEVVVGLSFMFFLLGAVVSGVNEAVAGALRWRAGALEQGIRQMLAGDGSSLGATSFVNAVLDHHLIQGAAARPPRKGSARRMPSYLNPSTFSLAVLDTLAPAPGTVMDQIRTTVAALPPETSAPLAQALPPAGTPPDVDSVAALQSAVNALADAGARDTLNGLVAQLAAGLGSDPMAQVVGAIDALPPGLPGKAPLQRFAADAAGSRDRFRADLEKWFDGAMDSVSGRYRRRVQLWLLAYAVVVVAVLNADSITVARSLYADQTVRQAVVAQTAKADQEVGQSPSSVAHTVARIQQLDLPLGWPAGAGVDRGVNPGSLTAHPGAWGLKLLGLVVTVLAVSLGAPFWFDLLGKFAQLRFAGPKPGPAP